MATLYYKISASGYTVGRAPSDERLYAGNVETPTAKYDQHYDFYEDAIYFTVQVTTVSWQKPADYLTATYDVDHPSEDHDALAWKSVYVEDLSTVVLPPDLEILGTPPGLTELGNYTDADKTGFFIDGVNFDPTEGTIGGLVYNVVKDAFASNFQTVLEHGAKLAGITGWGTHAKDAEATVKAVESITSGGLDLVTKLLDNFDNPDYRGADVDRDVNAYLLDVEENVREGVAEQTIFSDPLVESISDGLITQGRFQASGTVGSTPGTIDLDLEVHAGGATLSATFAGTVRADILIDGTKASVLRGEGGDDHLVAGGGNDNAYGGEGEDYLHGGRGNDVLNGGSGADWMVGGDGNDRFLVQNAGDVVRETDSRAAGGGVDQVLSYLETYTLGANVENGRIMQSDGARLSGNALDNVLDGGSGGDRLDGRAGADQMRGGAGDDAYFVRDAGDEVVEAAGGGRDIAYSYLASYQLAGEVEDARVLTAASANLTGNALGNVLHAGLGSNVIDGGSGYDTVSYAYGSVSGRGVSIDLGKAGAQATGGSGSDWLVRIEHVTGSAAADRLTGNTRGNVIDGGLGADTMDGGAGADTYVVRDAGDSVRDTGTDTAADQVQSWIGAYTFGTGVESGRVMSTGSANLTGNALGNALHAGQGDNVLNGGGGVDTASYAHGHAARTGVAVSLAVTASQATGGSGRDTLLSIENLVGTAYDDELTGSGGANRLLGGSGADIIDGGTGVDTMEGGAGSDRYHVRDAGDLAIEADANIATGGTDRVFSWARSYTLGSGIENARASTAGAADLVGNAADNILYAGAGGNLLDGGGGIDTVSYAYGLAAGKSGVAVSLATGGAQATGGSGTDTLLRVEHLVGSRGNDRLVGNAGANDLSGGDGNDSLDGGAGSDRMKGGAGNDSYHVREAGDVVTEGARAGTDIVYSYLGDYRLGVDIENGRVMAGTTASLVGNALDNVLYAGNGNNVLDGSTGTDTASYANAGAGVTVNLALTGAQGTGASGSDTLVRIEALAGSAYADHLVGNAASNTLHGSGGNDTLRGGQGVDVLSGGAGQDTFVYAAGDAVHLDFTDFGSDQSTVTTPSTSDTFRGAEVIRDFDFGDRLDLGNTALVANSRNFTPDSVWSSLDPDELMITGGTYANGVFTLGQESAPDTLLLFDGDGATAGVQQQAVVLTGTSWLRESRIELSGGVLRGPLGGSAGADRIAGTGGAEIVMGVDGNDTIEGLGGRDTLIGGSGDDVLIGGADADRLEGGDGADVYRIVADGQRGGPDLFLEENPYLTNHVGVEFYRTGGVDVIAWRPGDKLQLDASSLRGDVHGQQYVGIANGEVHWLRGNYAEEATGGAFLQDFLIHSAGYDHLVMWTDDATGQEQAVILQGALSLSAADFLLI